VLPAGSEKVSQGNEVFPVACRVAAVGGCGGGFDDDTSEQIWAAHMTFGAIGKCDCKALGPPQGLLSRGQLHAGVAADRGGCFSLLVRLRGYGDIDFRCRS
jgi:hypothetical protein